MVENTPKDNALRSEAAVLLSQARAQMLTIKSALSAASDASVKARLSAAASDVSNAVAAISRALNSSSGDISTADLAALESAVQSADVASLAGETPTPIPAGAASAAASVEAASAATRADVEGLSQDVFDRHIFDKYLHFSSAKDEAAFRRHTADVQKYVKGQLARGTAQGNLNASGGMVDYMLDAQAHGAGGSPDFTSRWNRLVADAERQRAAMRAAGQSTEEYDRNVKASVRRFLKAKGLSDADIDKRLAGGVDPLDAVKPFLKDDADSRRLESQMRVKAEAPSPAPPQGGAASNAAQLGSSFDAIASKLRNAGLQMSDAPVTTPDHGLGIGKAPAQQGQSELPPR